MTTARASMASDSITDIERADDETREDLLLRVLGERESQEEGEEAAGGDELPFDDEPAAGASVPAAIALQEALDLRRRSAGLRLIQPLSDLDRALCDAVRARGRTLDGYRIGLGLIRDVALMNTFGEGPTHKELRRQVAAGVREQWPDVPNEDLSHLVSLTLQVLENQRSKDIDKRFEAFVFDPVRGVQEPVRFRYFEFARSNSGEYRYRVMDEATLVYGALADHDLDRDLQAALHKMVEDAIRHGRMDRAERLSREQRAIARRIYQRIRTLISDIFTNARSVTWQGDMAAPVEEARRHLEGRIAEHERLRQAVLARRGEAGEPDTVQRLDYFLEELGSERSVILGLVNELGTAHQRFLDAQSAAFRFHRRKELPDPREVAVSLLSLPVSVMASQCDEMLRQVATIDPGRFFDLDRLLLSMRNSLEADDPGGTPPGGADDRISNAPPISKAVKDEAKAMVAKVLSDCQDADLAALHERMESMASSDLVRRVAGMRLYSLYGFEARKMHLDVAVDGVFENDLFKGANLRFTRSKAR